MDPEKNNPEKPMAGQLTEDQEQMDQPREAEQQMQEAQAEPEQAPAEAERSQKKSFWDKINPFK